MNKAELVNKIAADSGLSKKDSEKALTTALDAITEALANGEKVSLVGFGIFDIKERAERVGRNPRTGEATTIPASRVPQFKPGKSLKEAVTK
ncbi:MAG: HU family DNA-binding protein [Oscillospiraceae bacterium]|nr:HU family DNA-binding protein [Oscillospiraceae bacterium]